MKGGLKGTCCCLYSRRLFIPTLKIFFPFGLLAFLFNLLLTANGRISATKKKNKFILYSYMTSAFGVFVSTCAWLMAINIFSSRYFLWAQNPFMCSSTLVSCIHGLPVMMVMHEKKVESTKCSNAWDLLLMKSSSWRENDSPITSMPFSGIWRWLRRNCSRKPFSLGWVSSWPFVCVSQTTITSAVQHPEMQKGKDLDYISKKDAHEVKSHMPAQSKGMSKIQSVCNTSSMECNQTWRAWLENFCMNS